MLLIKQKYHFNFYPFEMADENEKLLMELMRKNENAICADCRRKGKWTERIEIQFFFSSNKQNKTNKTTILFMIIGWRYESAFNLCFTMTGHINYARKKQTNTIYR